MSYDLGLIAREGRPLPTVEALDELFRNRPNYRVQEGGSAEYEHAPTAVSFSIEYGTHRDEEGWDPIRITARTQAPHTRALELAEEVEAIAKAFDLLVNDPTMEGMGKGELDREALVRGCLFASRFGFCVDIAMRGLTDETVRLYDEDRMTEHWRWNRHREATAQTVGDDTFVPHVAYMAHGKKTLATVTWTGTMPFLLPAVDVIVTMDTSDGGARLKAVAAADLESALQAFPVVDEPAPHRAITPTPALLAAVATAKALSPELQRVSHEGVLGHRFWQATKDYYVQWSGGAKVASGSAPAKKKSGAKKKATSKKKAAGTKKTTAGKKPATKKKTTAGKTAATKKKASPKKAASPKKRAKPAARSKKKQPAKKRR